MDLGNRTAHDLSPFAATRKIDTQKNSIAILPPPLMYHVPCGMIPQVMTQASTDMTSLANLPVHSAFQRRDGLTAAYYTHASLML